MCIMLQFFSKKICSLVFFPSLEAISITSFLCPSWVILSIWKLTSIIFHTSTVLITLQFTFFLPFTLYVLWIAQFLLFFFFNWSGSILLALNYKIGGLKEKQFSKTSCWMMEVLDKRIHALWYQLYEVLYNGKWMYGWDKIRTVVVSGGMWVGLTKKGPEGNI